MSPLNFTHILTQAVDELSESESYKGLFHQHTDGNPLPSAKALCDIIELARAIIFPGYFGNSTVNSRTVTYHIGVNVERLVRPADRANPWPASASAGDGECSCCTELQREEAASIGRPSSSATCLNCVAHSPRMWKPLTTATPPHSRLARLSAAIRPSAPSATTASHTNVAHVGRAPHSPHHHRNGPQRNRNRYSSGSGHRRLFHDRPRYGCGNRRDLHHRQQREAVPGCDPRCQELPR